MYLKKKPLPSMLSTHFEHTYHGNKQIFVRMLKITKSYRNVKYSCIDYDDWSKYRTLLDHFPHLEYTELISKFLFWSTTVRVVIAPPIFFFKVLGPYDHFQLRCFFSCVHILGINQTDITLPADVSMIHPCYLLNSYFYFRMNFSSSFRSLRIGRHRAFANIFLNTMQFSISNHSAQ